MDSRTETITRLTIGVESFVKTSSAVSCSSSRLQTFLDVGLGTALVDQVAGARLVSSVEEVLFASDLDELQVSRLPAFTNAKAAAAILVSWFKSAPERRDSLNKETRST